MDTADNLTNYLLANDVRDVRNDCLSAFPWYDGLDEPRRAVRRQKEEPDP